MANVGAKIVPNGSSYCVLINHSSDSVATNYNLNVNGSLYATNLVLNSALNISYGGTGATTAALARTNLGITPANIGAAASTHNHAAGDINSGTLDIARGGTGATTAALARTSLGITPANIGASATDHKHAAGDITSGTLGVARGGTGVTANPAILVNLASTATSAVFAAAPRPGVTGTLPLGNGGTGATTAALARTALDVKATQTAVADPTYDGDSLTFIDSISQNTQGVISPHKASIKLATGERNGIVSITTQTFAGEKHFLNGIYSYSNIRMRETVNNSTAVYFNVNNLSTATTDHRLLIYEYPYNSSGSRIEYYERYSLPTPTNTITTNQLYSILTSKNAVTIAQGGTGATTSANARTNLGLGTAATHAHGDYVNLTDTQTVTGIKILAEPRISDGWIYWYNSFTNSVGAGILMNNSGSSSTNHQLYFRQYSYNTDGTRTAYYDYFKLPSVAVAKSTNDTYDILTSKVAITIAQGGTGKTTATEALAALGGATSSHTHTWTSSAVTRVTNSHLAAVTSVKAWKNDTVKIGAIIVTGASLAAYGTSSYITVATVPAAYKPATQIDNRVPVTNTNYICRLTTSGSLQLYKSGADSTTWYMTFFYPLA